MRSSIVIFFGLILSSAALAETKGNIEFATYRGSGAIVLPNYAAGPQTDLLWVSAQDLTATATHLVFTLTCPGLPTEQRMVQVWPNGPTTTVFERLRTQRCQVAVDAVVAGERQVFAVSGLETPPREKGPPTLFPQKRCQTPF